MGALGDTIRSEVLYKLRDNTLIPGLDVTQSATLKRVASPGTYNTATGTATDTPANSTIKIIPRAYTERQIRDSGGLLRAGDMEMKVIADSTVTAIGFHDLITWSGSDWKPIDIETPQLDGSAAIFRLAMRRV